MTPDAPIGMFDSGFGGLTVARAVIDLLPHENLVYIGDTGRYPYGNKPADEVRRYARELAHSLVEDYGAKMIVVACNTAASVALTDLQAELDEPGACGRRQRDVRTRRTHRFHVGARGDRADGSDDTDLVVVRHPHERAGAGLDHADDRYVELGL